MRIKTHGSSTLSVFSCFNTHKIVGKGCVKRSKILNYFKSSQNAPLRFKK